ncbi:MAG: N-acetylmuramoyl-L-alanine amidase [Alphaproteobacteria bacterium]|nr:MAG: N-acetylmuramoyl-L-alanine amidase [Alphaproteobacteria bacterium]
MGKGSALGLLCGLLVAGFGAATAYTALAADLPVATDARLGGDEALTRFVLDLTKRVEVSAFTLADPYRVVLDLPQVMFQLPAKVGETGRGLVKAFRFGLVMPGGSRIVLDATAPVRVEKAFVIDPVDSQPARLVLDLVAIDRDGFLRNIALENRPGRSQPPAKIDRDAKDADPRPLIVLDPGHGGLDSGTIAPTGDTEKAIVLEFAQQLRDKLEKSGKYRVAMTRTDDRFVPLADRVQLARSRQAALFLSIHADALPHRDSEARGASIYTLSETASDAEAARLAEAENRADVIAGVDLSAEPNDVADILIDLAQRETKAFSANFAHALAKELKATSRLHKHPLKSAGFRVLKAPDVPSALIELGYVSSSQDLKYLLSDAWRSRATDSIAQAITTFFATRLAGSGPAGGSN